MKKNNWNTVVGRFVVLNDGETYTLMEGCKVLFLNENGTNKVDDSGDINSIDKANDIVESFDIEELVKFWKENHKL